MLLKNKFLTVLFILMICVSALWAGDSAVFVDLGFSPDGRTYMFGQYGVLLPSLRPWAELFVVDMNTNNFVPNGKANVTQNTPIRAGQDGSGVFFQLLANNSHLTSRYSINNQNQGMPLYISRNENPPTHGETIEFRDFISNPTRSFRAQLVPSFTGSGQNIRSSFIINLEVRSGNGQVRNYTVGTPQVVRQQISQYNIKRVLIDSSGNSLIFVIEMKRVSENGFDVRYMVEAQRL